MGMSVTISAATAQDVEQIFRLQYLCFQREAELYDNYRIDPLVQSLDSLRAEVADDLVFVARLGDEGRRRGPGIRPIPTARAWIGKRLRPPPAPEGHGLGARLLLAAESALTTERSATRYRLHSGHRSESNLRLYRKAGYAQVGAVTGADGVRLILLEKDAAERDFVASA
ncbi:Acetyltransferase (GNAT) family protein [Streptomyces sp. Termitarium-T10T-6]|nr:Acetyltransferase (GNAT) family protein [Streptomyces sp. Termitarium-T10T-6]